MNIKAQAETFLHNLGVAIDHDYAKVVNAFADFIESKQKQEAAAVKLLEAAGYTVSAPTEVPTQTTLPLAANARTTPGTLSQDSEQKAS